MGECGETVGQNQNLKLMKITFSAIVGGLYIVLCVIFSSFASGAVQFRIAEALCLLPFYAPSTMFGLFAGCLVGNMLTSGAGLLDIVFGPLATLLAAYITSRLRTRWLTPLPAIVINAVVVGLVLSITLTPEAVWQSFPVIAGQVALGEAVVCCALGLPMMYALARIPYFRKMFPKRFMDASKENQYEG